MIFAAATAGTIVNEYQLDVPAWFLAIAALWLLADVATGLFNNYERHKDRKAERRRKERAEA